MGFIDLWYKPIGFSHLCNNFLCDSFISCRNSINKYEIHYNYATNFTKNLHVERKKL